MVSTWYSGSSPSTSTGGGGGMLRPSDADHKLSLGAKALYIYKDASHTEV